MSSQSVIPLSHSLASPTEPRRARAKLSVAGLSINGVLLFVLGFMVVASGFTSLRPNIGGFMVHPYLGPVALAFPFVVMSRIHMFPVRALVAILVFTGMYCFSVFNGASVAVGEIFKTGSAIVTIVTCALLVRRRGDFVAGALGLSIAVALLAAHGMREPSKLGVEAMQGANKNSYSLFALPAMLMAGFVVLRIQIPVAVKAAFVICTIPALAAIFMSGNRSGYLGCVLIGLMLFWERRGKGMLLVGAMAAIVAVGLVQLGKSAVFDQRMKQTMEGNKSDEHRLAILEACLQIAVENPVIGVSPQVLPFEIGRRTSRVSGVSIIEAHNIFAHVLAASGVICFCALLGTGWSMWTWKPRDGGRIGGKEDPLRESRKLLRMMVVLWVVRGMFTREILFNPSFNIGLGLCIGLCMLAELARQTHQGPETKTVRALNVPPTARLALRGRMIPRQQVRRPPSIRSFVRFAREGGPANTTRSTLPDRQRSTSADSAVSGDH